ncbi:MAG: Nif3-like dinuclear metal center hexameric protein [Bacillota bacterium]|jgi:dinuclear metal center YbgI/SA1388 family protein|nr:Nif3-like dinuclear metal center hexameric protein [Bacillota bacterium]HPZ22321.1 Nif3-like dinuclear metal center hexameric protein [Bacillota bacterium]HQD20238.1 Nif3-like dinuclear metal center hexameric protein [Bacillota bacterium]
MSVKAGRIVSLLQQLAPLHLQEDWDNSGLQVGSLSWQTDKILLALDVTPEVVEYASKEKCGFILSHHPLIFHKLSRIDASTPVGACIAGALTNRICIYAMHTNLDVIPGGVSDALAALLQLQDIQVLDKDRGDYCKLAVYVPDSHLEQVRTALGDAGAGWMGNYSHCTFASPGRGQFLPREGANPWLGQQGQLEEVSEYKLETLVQRSQLAAVLAAMKKAHPYEEVAYDIVPLENKGEHGLGRIGHLPQPMALGDFAARLAKMLGCPAVKVCGEKARQVSKVAVCGGSGGDLVTLAHYSGADVLVTGDVGHHAALEAAGLGLSLVDPGHYASEFPVIKVLESYLQDNLKEIAIIKYPGTDPFWIQTVQGEMGEERP